MRDDYNVNHTSNEIFFNKNEVFSSLIQVFSKIPEEDWKEITATENKTQYDEVYSPAKLFDYLSNRFTGKAADTIDLVLYQHNVSRLDIEFIVGGNCSRVQTFPTYPCPPLIRVLKFAPTVEIDFASSTFKSPFFFTTLLRELKRAGIYDYDVTSSRSLIELLSLTLWTMNFVGKSTLGDPDTYHNAIGVTAQVIRRWNFGPEEEIISDRDRMHPISTGTYFDGGIDEVKKEIHRLNHE